MPEAGQLTYKNMMQLSAAAVAWDRVLHWFYSAQAAGIPCTPAMYACAMNALRHSNKPEDWGKVQGVLQEKKDFGIQPRDDAYR